MIHLTGHNYNAREIIQNIFSPLVGVLSSPCADEVCHRNNLSFVEMLQPFAKLQNDAHFRDVSGTSVSIRGLRLNFCEVDWRPPQTVLARKMLNESVTNANNEKTKLMNIGELSLELPTEEPWFENWRETFLTVQFPADHEFTRHLLSCLIILSSGDPNIVETAQKLSQRVHLMQSVNPQKLPKWFHASDVLNSYVVLHEGSQGDLSRAQQGYELLKSTFGDSKCFLIQINSLDANVGCEVADYWAPYIKRQPKSADGQGGSLGGDQQSASRTPQDAVSVVSLPAMQTFNSADAVITNNVSDSSMVHPLSPIQEHAMEAINSKFSVSSESISSQPLNPNVWAGEQDADAPHGGCLNAMDVENLRHFVQDYAVRALIPYVEHLVTILSEGITNKKGVSKSLLSATKRWFVTSKPGAGASTQNAVIYTHESAELQTRKLGDLYFMFCHYNVAFQAYHQAKRDFNADSAWQYYAGALEMAALSAFMLGTANRKTYDYMEDAIMCYLNVCKLQQFATRATLLSMECLKTARLYGEAAKQLIRMTSEESDLRSALLLEQAAYCFLAATPAMHRKYAFQIVLSGNRYSRAGQRKHAYRCYSQAYQVFQQRGWSLAEDHIQYTMAKQAYMLKNLEKASHSFAQLLRPASLQSAQQQLSFLKEYIQVQNELIKRSPELGLLPLALPQVIQNSIRVLTMTPSTPANPLYVPASNIDIKLDLKDESIWYRIEEMIVTVASSNKPLLFKPSCNLFSKENPAAENPIAIQGEPIEIAVTIMNTIRCAITFSQIDFLWKLKLDENHEEISNMCLYESVEESPGTAAVKAAIKTSPPQTMRLEEHAEETVYFRLTPKLTGRLTIVGMVGQVASTIDPSCALVGALYFETQRIRSAAKQAQQILFDNKLCIHVIPTLPALSVSFSSVPADLIVGEIVPVTISLRNEGIKPIEELFLGCDNPRWLTLLDTEAKVPLSILSSIKDLSDEKLVRDKEICRQHVYKLLKHNSKESAALGAQEGISITAWIQAPYEKGEFTLRLLFYYSFAGDISSTLRYRLVRHNWKFNIHEGLRSDVTCVVSNTVSGELGLNVDVRNENKMHHPLMTEVYVNSLALYCDKYRLNAHKFYLMNSMEISGGLLGERCIKSGKSASFQCRLTKAATRTISNTPSNEILKSRLSYMDVMPTQHNTEPNIPAMSEFHGFLAKHETIYFNTNVNTEEFNSIVANCKPHTTLALCWTAVIVQNSVQRVTFGQHFVRLRSLYEHCSCPSVDHIQFGSTFHRERISIEEFARHDPEEAVRLRSGSTIKGTYNGEDNNDEDNGDDDDDNDEYWENNDNFVGQRCLLEDENFVLTAKA